MKIASCSATTFAIRYPDQATCESREKAQCMATLAAPSTGNSPQATEACVTALQGTVICADYLDSLPPAACQAKFGTLAAGSPCAFNGQCQSSVCGIGPGSVCGMCLAGPVAAGASCASLFCGPGLECAFFSKTCGAPEVLGAACDTLPCGPDLVCAGTNGMRTCQAIASTAGAGQPCGNINGAHVVCAAQGFCVVPMGQAMGICTAAAADGAACDDTNGPRCAIPARCVSGKCTLADATACH
jgi:hypothetical protein